MITETLGANGFTTPVRWYGDPGTIFATGVFGGGGVRLQASLDGVNTWYDTIDPFGATGLITANGSLTFEVGGCYLRASLTGATAPNLTIRIATRK